MENLTKENYFEYIKIMFPKCHHLFFIWVEKYIKKIEWPCPDYFQLPVEFQMGMFMSWAADLIDGSQNLDNVKDSLHEEFMLIEAMLMKRESDKIKLN